MRYHEQRRGGRRSMWWIAVAAAVVAVAGSVAVVLLHDPAEEAGRASVKDGCETSEDCPDNAACASGGCFILLSSEFRNMWEHDIRAQLDPEESWKPAPFFGEKLMPARVCPPPSGDVTTPDEGHLHHLMKTAVFDLGATRPVLHRQLRTRGSMWFESLRFWMPPGLCEDLERDAVCVAEGMPAAIIGRGKWRGRQASYVDVALPQAIPVGGEARSAVAVTLDEIPDDESGYRLLTLELDPVFDGAAERTVVALPLGSDVPAIEGPPPTRQRLLTGYVAYTWEHGNSPSRVAVRYRLPADLRHQPDLDEVTP